MSSIIKNCKFCAKALPENGDYAHCSLCEENYHFSPCSTVAASTWKAMSKRDKSDWKCQQCRAERNRANSLSIVFDKATTKKQQRNNEDDEEPRENKRPRSTDPHMSTHAKNDIEFIQDKLKVFENNFCELKNMLSEINNNISGLSNVVSNLENKVGTLFEQVKELKEENRQKDKQIESLEERLNSLEQKGLETNVEILNLPVADTPKQAVLNVAENVGFKMHADDISDIFHLKKKGKIIVKFKAVSTKIEFMRKIKIAKPTSDRIKDDEPNKRIFVNDELTALNRFLLWKTKNKAKEFNWRYVWVKDGKIMAKKEEVSRIVYIRKEPDIDNIK